MVKQFELVHLDRIMKIWLEANIHAHDFIPAQYWYDNFDYVKTVLPQATVLVYETEGEVRGFVGILDESYVAGLFVSIEAQSQGIGSTLIEACKQTYCTLSLDVYAKNTKAINFYNKHGFDIVQEKINDDTRETEYAMRWETNMSNLG